MAKVYVVHAHESCEGSTIIGVFPTKEEAEGAISSVAHHFGEWRQVSEGLWESGCDEINIEEHEVKP